MLEEKPDQQKVNLHSSAEEDVPDGEVKTRAVRGVASLFARQGVLRLLGFFGMLVLARILTPEMFGVFAIANFVVIFFEEVSSLGLSAALLRKKENVTEIELRTVFFLQQGVVGVSLIAILVLAPYIASHYELDADYIWLIRVLGIALFLASLKTIPSILLQRQLRHDLLAVSEVAEYLVYITIAVTMALLDYGVWSLVVATLLRGLVGVIILFRMSWWTPAFGFDMRTAKEILRFGLPIQLGNFSALANNAVVPVVVGSYLGTSAVGLVNFAKKLLDAIAHQPLILIGKVQLRVFGRVQDEPERLVRLVETSLFIGGLVTFYMLAMFVSQAELFINLVVTDKWSESLSLIYIAVPGYMAFVVLMPYLQVLKATGDAITPLIALTARFTLQVLIFLSIVADAELKGYAVALVIAIFVTVPYITYKVHKIIRPKLVENIVPSLLSGMIAGVSAYALAHVYYGFVGMVVGIVLGTIVYFSVLGVLCGVKAGGEISRMLSAVAPGSSRIMAMSKYLENVFIRLDFSHRRATDAEL